MQRLQGYIWIPYLQLCETNQSHRKVRQARALRLLRCVGGSSPAPAKKVPLQPHKPPRRALHAAEYHKPRGEQVRVGVSKRFGLAPNKTAQKGELMLFPTLSMRVVRSHRPQVDSPCVFSSRHAGADAAEYLPLLDDFCAEYMVLLRGTNEKSNPSLSFGRQAKLTSTRREDMLKDPREAPTFTISPSEASSRVATACETFSTWDHARPARGRPEQNQREPERTEG